MTDYDVGVIGGGIAGASVAYAAARRGMAVVMLEREDVLCAHSTGRSAASADPTIGPAAVQVLTRASVRWFIENDTAERPLLTRRPILLIGSADGRAALERLAMAAIESQPRARLLSGAESVELCPVLRPTAAAAALWMPDAFDIDTELLFEQYVAHARAAGMQVRRGFGIEAMDWRGGAWVLSGPEIVRVRVVVNAAGAWADQVAAMASASALGLRPLRRTALAVAGPDGCERWPLVADLDETFYLKPWGRSELLLSPADETPDEPRDARAEELDVARCIEAVNAATTLSIRHVRSTWAGHRTFAADRCPVVGFDADAQGFFWCAGLGGAGIQTSPAIGELAGALLADDEPATELEPFAHELSPRRFAPSR